MNAARLMPARSLVRAGAGRAAAVSSARPGPAAEPLPQGLRSEAFAEDLPDTALAHAVPLSKLPAPVRGTARSAPLALVVATALAALLGALGLGLGG